MPKKFGRPISTDLNDPLVAERREKARIKKQDQRHRTRAQTRLQVSNAASSPLATQTTVQHPEVDYDTIVEDIGLRIRDTHLDVESSTPINHHLEHHQSLEPIIPTIDSTDPPKSPPYEPPPPIQDEEYPPSLPPGKVDLAWYTYDSEEEEEDDDDNNNTYIDNNDNTYIDDIDTDNSLSDQPDRPRSPSQEQDTKLPARSPPPPPREQDTTQYTQPPSLQEQIETQTRNTQDINDDALGDTNSTSDSEAYIQDSDDTYDTNDPHHLNLPQLDNLDHLELDFSGLSSDNPTKYHQHHYNEDEYSELLPPRPQVKIPATPSRTPSPQSSDADDDFHAFATHNSSSLDPIDGHEDEIPHVDRVADKVLQQLLDFTGCTQEEHDNIQINHNNDTPADAHTQLQDLFDLSMFPSALSEDKFLSPKVVANHPIEASDWQSAFCGISPSSTSPKHACLHSEETQQVTPQVAYDIDSYLGFASSLAFARTGLMYQPVPIATQNLTHNVHIDLGRPEDSDAPDADLHIGPLHKIPHFCLGHVYGAHHVPVLVLFPHLPVANEDFQTNFIKREVFQQWFHHIWNPVISEYLDPHIIQHIPSGFEHAHSNSRARQVEDRMTDSAGYATQQAISYFIAPEFLDDIWTTVLAKTTESGFRQFRDPQIYFSARGTKLEFKSTPSRPTLLQTLQHFRTRFEDYIDLNFVHRPRLFVDVGQEICAGVSRVKSEDATRDEQPQVYHWKRCCLESCVRWLYDDRPPKSGSTYYNSHFLRDACGLTLQPRPKSSLRQGGLIYCQFYSSVKEPLDANKTYPFQNEGLEELTIDPSVLLAAQTIGKGHRRDTKVIQAAYLASKRRLRHALQASSKKSFGIRAEYRVSWEVFSTVLDRLTVGDYEPSILDDAPSYVWPIQTQKYLDYVGRNADRFLTGFEIARVRGDSQFYAWEQTKIMAMFLRCLQFSVTSTQFSRQSALWWSTKQRVSRDPDDPVQRTWHGLGFSETLPQYGFCWIQPRINWEDLVFRSDVTDQIMFGNSSLRGRHVKHGGAVLAFFDVSRRVELGLQWLVQYANNQTVVRQVIDFLVLVCQQQMRIDVLTKLSKTIVPDELEEALTGEHPFTAHYFTKIFGEQPHCVKGNRTGSLGPIARARHLFAHGDGKVRANWGDKPFRKIYWRCLSTIRTLEDGDLETQFDNRFFQLLLAYHWIMPHPSRSELCTHTKQGKTTWYSIMPHRRYNLNSQNFLDLQPSDWRWARAMTCRAYPPLFPLMFYWDKDAWDDFLRTQPLNDTVDTNTSPAGSP